MPTTDLDTELAAERTHLTESRAALRRMRDRAESLFATGDKVAGDSYTAEQLGRHMARRVKELADDPDTPLFFGRLDIDDSAYHVGRRHVTDDAGEPMVLDWRAPLSRSFYRASVRDPQGVAVRRRFGFVKGELTSFEDEHLDRGEELGTSSRILTAEIERPRVGPMRDIVATIQPEQDELVRADLADSICVQGAPGTGKTAVGLHRAAYLLYLHRERLRKSKVLIVGPNTAFLSYISAVLPTLGEVEVLQSTLDDLVGRAPVKATDTDAAKTIKHDVRMAEVLSRALWSRVTEPTEPIMVSDGSYRWRIDVEPLRRIVDEARREGLPYSVGRERVRARVVGLLQRQSEYRTGNSPSEPWLRRMSRIAPVTGFLESVWPAVTPESLVGGVLTEPPTGLLTDEEREAIRWVKPPKTVKSAKFSTADLLLIDEAAGLLERETSFGHVVVDEAQDLSPMQARAIARRSEHGSITLLGDLAQGTAPWATTDWRDILGHLGKPDAAVVPLTVGFRVPEVVVRLANRLLPALGVNVPAAVSLRHDGDLAVVPVAEPADLDAVTMAELTAALVHEGSVAVIAADAAVERLRAHLDAAGIEHATPDDVDAGARVTVVPATLVKGLEYDHVIVHEPADIVAAEPKGLNRLYVVLTRAVTRLSVLHAKPLPEALTLS
ncbi:DNA helicase [Actinoplanes lobatus]|uniref:DNA helicase n=1 Tax=Actinoplanes lobatus TaxID=113568 RepID=A0A7W7HDJ0_9ACTN|nr:AAA family ATPase [Actinoplanes lobatus]MBB4748147.1 DNA helicase IV [Actinoplanes lobatus]GGN69895.1 DNA helicase [Actinoplanes lobatus]GIE39996.1 DNA helicase [Actinoplanes lobatus]